MRTGFSSLVIAFGVVTAAELVAGCCGCPQAANAAPVAGPAAPASVAVVPNASADVVAVKTCPGALAPAADGLIDDLEDNNNQVQQSAGRGGYWWAAKDDKGSTIEPMG